MSRLFFVVLILLSPSALAQSVTLDLGQGGAFTGRLVQMIALLTVLSLAPSLLMMVTSFTRIVIVFGVLRTALGMQQSPPNSVLLSLALFLTFFIMQPTLQAAYKNGIAPLINQSITEKEALDRTIKPFHAFMVRFAKDEDIALFTNIGHLKPAPSAAIPMRVLIPAFMISELKRAFEIGFLIFIPFLIIDMVVASILMSLGMMMIPPVTVSLPFKLIFFVLVDGWHLLVGSLVRSFGVQ